MPACEVHGGSRPRVYARVSSRIDERKPSIGVVMSFLPCEIFEILYFVVNGVADSKASTREECIQRQTICERPAKPHSIH